MTVDAARRWMKQRLRETPMTGVGGRVGGATAATDDWGAHSRPPGPDIPGRIRPSAAGPAAAAGHIREPVALPVHGCTDRSADRSLAPKSCADGGHRLADGR